MMSAEHRIKSSLIFWSAWLLPSLVCVAFYLPIADGVRELWLATIRFNLDVYATSSYSAQLQMLMHHRIEILCDLILLLWVASRIIRKSHKPASIVPRPLQILFVGYYIASRLVVILMGKYFPQHYAMTIVLTAVLAADILSRISASKPQTTNWIAGSVAIGLILLSNTQGVSFQYLNAAISGDPHPITYAYEQVHGENETKWLRTEALASYLERQNVEGKRIECFGMSPGIYWRTRTASASRFSMMHPLVLESPSKKMTDYQLRWRREFIDSLLHVHPIYLIVADSDALLFPAAYYRHTIPTFDSVIAADYTPDTNFLNWTIYRRR